MNARLKIVLGSLVGALAVQGAFLACGGGGGGGKDGTSDAAADEVTSSGTLVAATVSTPVPRVGSSVLLAGPVVVTDVVCIDAVEITIGDATCSASAPMATIALVDKGPSEYGGPIHGARMYIKAGQSLCAKWGSGDRTVSAFGFRPGP